MELAGLKVVMDADFSAVYAGFKQANAAAKRFQKNTADIFKGINVNPELSNGANLASQIQEAQKAAASASKAFQTNRKLEIAGTKELLAVQRQAATEANSMTAANLKYSIDAINRKTEAERKAAAEGNNITAANLKASINAINRRNEAQQRSAAAAIQAYNAENQAVIDNIRTTKNLQAAINKINAAKAREKDLYGELVAENQKLVREYYNAAAAVAKYGKSSGITTKDLEQMQAAALKGQQQLQQIEQGAGRFHRNVGNYASAFNPLTLGVSQFARELPNLAFGARTFFMSISNQFGQLQDGFAQLKRSNAELIAQGKPAKSAISSLASAVFSWNTAISIGVTLLTVYGPKLFEMAKNGFKNVEAIKAQKEYQDKLNEAVSTANKEAGDQISRLRVLSDTMQNANLTMGQRTAAYDEAVKMAPIHLSNLSKEEALTKGLADRINNDLVPAIMAAARARAYEQKIQIAQERLIDLEIEQNENLRKRAEIQKSITPEMREQAKRAAEIAKLQAGSRGFGSGLASTQIADEIENLERSNIALNENARERIALNKELEKYSTAVQRALTASKGLGLDTEKIGESVEAVAESSKEAAPAVDDMAEAFERMTSIQFDAEELREYMRQVIAIVDEANRSNTDRIGIQLVSKDSVDKSLAEAKSYVSSAVKDLAGHFQKQTTAAFMGLGETIGNAFNGQNFDIVSGIIGVLGDQLKQLGAYLIEVGVTKEAIAKALSALGLPGGGAGVVIAGVAAVALGQVLKNAAQKRMQNLGGRREFAAGGVVYGPTNALVGEYRGASSNPEVIAPLDKLTNILRNEGLGSGNMQPIVLTTRVDGQDLLLSQERAKKWRDR